MPSTCPLPSLPLELKHEVLKFCDPSTLANASRVSLAFLHLSSPLLYRDIVVGSEQLKKLLSYVIDQHLYQPQLQSYLDLSLVRSITLHQHDERFFHQSVDEEDEDEDEEEALFVPSRAFRSFPSGRIPLESLELVLYYARHWITITDFFDPSIFRLRGAASTGLSYYSNASFHGWERLREIVLTDAFTSNSLTSCGIGKGDDELQRAGLKVFYRFTEKEGLNDREVDGLTDDLVEAFNGGDLSLLGEVEITVSNLEDRGWVMEILKRSPILERITVHIAVE